MGEKKRLIVTGYGRHGKDTFCKMLNGIAGYTFTTSSLVASEIVFNEIGEIYSYGNSLDCWKDRANHRAEWYRIITSFNTPNKSRLAKKIFREFDIYCGIRNADEFRALKSEGLFDLSLWVDASSRLPPKGEDSMTIRREDCSLII